MQLDAAVGNEDLRGTVALFRSLAWDLLFDAVVVKTILNRTG